MEHRAETPDPAPALTRGLEILRRLNADGPSTLGQLARAAQWPKSSTSRLLAVLERAGLVAREPVEGRFRAAVALVPLALAEDALRAWSGAPLVRLCQASGQTVELYAYRNGRLAMVDRSDPEEAEVRVWARIGWEPDPTELTAVTQLRLAFGGDGTAAAKRRDLWVWNGAARRPVRGPELAAVLRRVRREAFAVCLARNPRGVVRFAVPLLGPNGDLHGIVGIAATPARADGKTRARFRKLLETAVRNHRWNP